MTIRVTTAQERNLLFEFSHGLFVLQLQFRRRHSCTAKITLHIIHAALERVQHSLQLCDARLVLLVPLKSLRLALLVGIRERTQGFGRQHQIIHLSFEFCDCLALAIELL